MKFKSIILILLTLVVTSCGSPQGKVKRFGNLEIFYPEKVPVEYVDKLGAFFKANELINPDKTHSVKLTSEDKKFVLKMILNPDLDSVPENKLKEIAYLERAIDTTVFSNQYIDIAFEIEITDAYFNSLINQ